MSETGTVNPRIRLGISSCLLGNEVRYNGQHKLDRFLAETLGKYMDYVPVCPEVECGLPVPREPMRLVGSTQNPRLITSNTGIDHTDRMLSWAAERISALKKEELCGFIFKAKSPSSGMERVKVYNGRGGLSGRAPGMFAKAFMEAFPLLPVEDEGRLHDPGLRENFIERIFALNRYRAAVSGRASIKKLMQFHAEHKFLIMAHSPKDMRLMGRMLAGAGKAELQEVRKSYEDCLLRALKLEATVRKHTDVLQHMQGFMKQLLSADEKAELSEVIAEYKAELIPLVVPVTLINHYVRKYKVDYLSTQYYLNPHPLELKLRNHA